jgi:hypothetical protein
MDINSFMSGNQSFNQSLYAPLTRPPLVCRPSVYFTRKVYMKRRPIVRGIISAGVSLQLALLLCCLPLHAQTGAPSGVVPPGGAPPGMEDVSPLDPMNHARSAFDDRTPKPEQHVLTADHAPGDMKGVARYPSGLPMAGAQVVILNADVDVERSTISAEDGSFSFKKLKPAHYQLSAKIDGYASPGIMDVVIVPGQTISSDISLRSTRGTSISARSSGSGYRSYGGAYRAEPASLRVADPQPTAASPSENNVATAEATNSATSIATEKTPVAASSEVAIPAAVADELAAMRRRIDELESELKGRGTAEQPAAETPAAAAVTPAAAQDQAAAPVKLLPGQYLATGGTASWFKGDQDIPTHPDGFDPFSYADWTWMNANGRQHDSPWSTKYFTPEFRADVNYMDDFNHPRDDTMGGSTESFRVNEWQLEQLSLGGDIRIGHVRGRILTMFGLFSTTTPRNDPSVIKGQWDLSNAYRYISEGWGGYHFDVNHGLNIDAGIFVSYIGLFSYYNFDNWTYQPSYVSSNTPWFFNGLRIQWFPTAKLKIEPWIINGWQSYARANSKPGLGGQILWRPKPWFSAVFNNYGMGTDDVGAPLRSRIHTDDSFEIREYNQPDKFLDMMAMSFTGDLGCEYGGGLSCYNDKNGNTKQAFLGWMAYQRFQFAHDHYGITLGGGQLNNPGRYLTLLPPINGAGATTGSPYFTGNPGDKYHAYDATATFEYMPSQWLTFLGEMGYRHSDVPYWSGRNGITPPGGNTGSPGSYVCTNGSLSVASTFTPSGSGFYQSSSLTPLGDNGQPQGTGGPVDLACNVQMGGTNTGPNPINSGWHAWAPDLRHSQIVATFAIMTRF